MEGETFVAFSSTSEERGNYSARSRVNKNNGETRSGRQDQGKRDYNKGIREGGYTPRFQDGDANRYSKFKKESDGARNQRTDRNGSNQGKDFKRGYNNNTNTSNTKDYNRGNSRNATTAKETKVKEQQPDKMDTIRRLEKEKKAIQKKTDSNSYKAKTQNARPQVKVKRTNNIDWTKEYENDSFEDDDVYYDV